MNCFFVSFWIKFSVGKVFVFVYKCECFFIGFIIFYLLIFYFCSIVEAVFCHRVVQIFAGEKCSSEISSDIMVVLD